jgi:hypothetical protein
MPRTDPFKGKSETRFLAPIWQETACGRGAAGDKVTDLDD